jgi:gamma-polyglutamate biosynthesis protein CapC
VPVIAGQMTFNLFPASGLDNSLFTAVFLGLLLLFVLTESFGWVFTGLVVPGYLASVLVIQPVAGGVILAEAVATYFVARAISDWGSRVLPYNRFFGRERFFLILLVSVGVRLVFEALLLPTLGTALVDEAWVAPTLVTHLYSIGLIVVPLTANMMWRTGAWRGLPQVVLPTAVLWLALSFVLIPYTNLSISDFELTYENVALGFLASPKTYIILLTGAYLATRNSLDWGWDSHGIVVMALVALAWLSPMKVLTTVVEVLILVGVLRVVLALPLVRAANLGGYRRIVVVFGIGFLLKFVACHLMAATYPGLRATDYFGFGYLLPSLLALKVLQRGSASVVLLPTLQTSLIALGLGTAIGLGLTLLDPGDVGGEANAAARSELPSDEVRGGVMGEVHAAAGRLLQGLPPASRGTGDELTPALEYQRLVRDIVGSRDLDLAEASARAASLGLLLVDRVDPEDHQRYLVLKEPPGELSAMGGWGVVAVRVGADRPLVVEVPHPVDEPGSLVAGTVLFRELGAAALVVSGVDPGAHASPARRMAAGGGAAGGGLPLVAARKALAERPSLEVRVLAGSEQGVLWEADAAAAVPVLPPRIAALERRPGPGPGSDSYGHLPSRGRSRLQLSEPQLLALRSMAYRAREELVVTEPGGLSSLTGSPWFSEHTAAVGYREPRESERVFFERELFTPLMATAAEVAADGDLLAYLDRTAALMGYSVRRLELGDGEPVLVLFEALPATRGWGTLLVRPEAGTERFVAVPKPAGERYSLDLGLHLLRDLDAASLIVAGAEPTAVLDRSSNVVGEGNLETLFTQAHRVAYRVPGEPVGLQVRGYRSWRPLRSPVILASGVLGADLQGQAPELEAVGESLKRIGVPVRSYDGSQELIALRGYGIPQVHLARNLDGRPYAVAWASRGLRRRVAVGEGRSLTHTAVRAGAVPVEVWLDEHWAAEVAADAVVVPAPLSAPPAVLDAAWQRTLRPCSALLRTGDLRYLGDAFAAASEEGIRATWLVDAESGLPVLWLQRDGVIVAVNLLAPDESFLSEIDDPVAALRTGLVPLLVVVGG